MRGKKVHIQVSRDGVAISAPATHAVVSGPPGQTTRQVTMRMSRESAMKLAQGLAQLLGHELDTRDPLEHTLIGAPHVEGRQS